MASDLETAWEQGRDAAAEVALDASKQFAAGAYPSPFMANADTPDAD